MKTADIVILDFWSQYTQLIARRWREQGVYAELYHNVSIDMIKTKDPKGIILSGGPASVYAKDAYLWWGDFDLGLADFRIYYGMKVNENTLCYKLFQQMKEHGKATLNLVSKSELNDMPDSQQFDESPDRVRKPANSKELQLWNSPFCAFWWWKLVIYASLSSWSGHTEFGDRF